MLEAEYRALYGDDALAAAAPADADGRLRALHHRIHGYGPTALCLSGGGIRSATLALGILQGLANVGVLGNFDYLSTVSGGGYTGGWFTAWLRREGAVGRAQVLRQLDPARAADRRSRDAAEPIAHVRRTCRYLAPQGGIVSADMWAVLATMGRNLFLNWLVILPLLAAALLVPRLYYAVVSAVESGLTAAPCLTAGTPPAWLLGGALTGFSVASIYTVLNFAGVGGGWSQGRFLRWFLVPLLAGSVAATLFWSSYPCSLDLRWAVGISAALPALTWLVFGSLARRRGVSRDGSSLRAQGGMRTALAALVSGPILGLGAYWFATYPFGFGDGEPLRELYAVLAVPIVLLLVVITIAIFVGLASGALDDAALEWWSRCSGWIGIAAMLWMVAGVLVFYMADLLEASLQAMDRALNVERQTSATVFTAVIPLLSSLAGLAARGTAQSAQPSAARLALQRTTLPVIVLVLLCSVAWVNLRVLERLEYHRAVGGALCSQTLVGASEACHPVGAGAGEIAMYGAGLVVMGLATSWFVPTNRFSLHGMYRQRLIRTFLGASRKDRAPNSFTGFDANDDLNVHDLRDVRPLHVITATLNAVSSTHVGRHERQAESFTFTPLHVGNQSVGYRQAAEYGSDGGKPATGLSLGMALAVSGAAASSAMGIYSSKARAFLLTLANARLGLWFGPPLGIGPLIRELLGLTTDRNPYVYLSDGGHYENLGVWEMVARRCRFIVVSDAGCDPTYSFDDLSNAVRRIRLDLGVPIEFPPLDLSRDGQGHTNRHGLVGVVRYSVVDGPTVPDGTILYLKATLSGDEPVDVWNFARIDRAFPHDSTSDQFFDEARFESYRALGFHTVLSVANGFSGVNGVRGLFDAASHNLGADR